MTPARLEHVNISVNDPDANAEILCKLFGWTIRWSGPSMNDGYTVHVGTDRQYIAFYTCNELINQRRSSQDLHNLNHIALIVDDLKQAEQAVIALGFTPFNYGNYDPGQRFYFYLQDELEVEVVCYTHIP